MSHQISLLIDTNVWMDYYDASRSGSKAAFKLINNALEHGAELVYTVPSSKDVFYLIGRAYKGVLRAVNQERSSEDLAVEACEMAWGCVRNMSEIATAVGCDGRDVWDAAKTEAFASRLRGQFDYCCIYSAGSDALKQMMRVCFAMPP